MNTGQYGRYFESAWNEVADVLNGKKYRNIQIAGDFAATIAANYLQQAESEKAYQRSKPTTQVKNMMSAGMSRAGALNAINGGGSYTPAPIQAATPGTAANNVAQNDLATANAVMSGLSGMASNIQQFMQLKNQNKQFYETLKHQREEAAKQREHELLLKDVDTANATQNQFVEYQKHKELLDWNKKQFEVLSPYQIRHIEAQINKINADVSLTKVQKEDLQYKAAEYVSNRSVRDAVSLLQELESVYKYHVTQQDFNDFKRSYMYYDEETDSYQYITHSKPLTNVEAYVTQFWDVVAKIFPANKIGKIINEALSK